MKFVPTKMMIRYIFKLMFRVSVFSSVLVVYIFRKDLLVTFMTQPVKYGITPLHVLWAIFMLIMISHLFPTEILSMALRKSKEKHYVPIEGYSELDLMKFVKDQNIKAWMVMLVWLLFNSIFGILYLAGVIDTSDLFMLTTFYFLSDYICILFFCPFQTFIMKNKCCVNCRIYDWGHFMMFTPMLFIKDFFSWSLFITATIVLIHWEITYAKHPERFWSGSNQILACASCKDRTCQIKTGIRTIATGKKANTNS